MTAQDTAEQGCRMLLDTLAAAATPPAPAKQRADRLQRFLRRLDDHLAGLPNDAARRRLLERLTDGWQHRYAAFVGSGGLSEYCEPGAEPIQASDFMLTILAIGARRGALGAA